jgi:hypothetical protein
VDQDDDELCNAADRYNKNSSCPNLS